MTFWGWRQGACAVFISVLVTACVPAQHSLSSPTFTPLPVTLTVVKPPGASQTPRAPRILTATPAHQSITLDVLPPRCDDLLNGGVQCIGVLRNNSPETVGWVILRATGINMLLEQHIVPAGTDAPYRFFMDTSVETLILSLESVVISGGWVALEVTDERGTITEEGYHVQARLLNPSVGDVLYGRAMVMIFDGDELLTYRVLELGELANEEGIDLDVFWYGVTGETLRHTISAIAWEA